MATEKWNENPNLKKLYISKLKPETTNEDLIEYFTHYGEVTDCKIVKDNQGSSRGFAFLTMSNQADVDTVLDKKPHMIRGQTVFMRRAIPKDDPDPLAQTLTKKLFIGGLTEEATEEDITAVLSNFTDHQPEQIKLMRDRNTNKFKGYAFATFQSEDVVDKLFIIRNATIKSKRVELKKAEEIGAPGAGGRGGGRGGGGRGRGGGRGGGGEYRGRGARGVGYSANQGGYPQSYGNSYGEGHEGYSGSGGYSDYGYGNSYGYGGSSGGSSGGSYGGGSYGGGGDYGGGYDGREWGIYKSEASGYGPNRRGRGAGGGGGGGGYHPY